MTAGPAWRAPRGSGLEPVDEIDHVVKAATGTGAYAASGDCDGEMGLAGAGPTDQHDVALLGDEAAAGEVMNERLVDRRAPCINPNPRTQTMRPYWKGYLKLALVSCPIALHAACSTAERIAFRQINKATGNRLRQQLIDEETREPVKPEHKGRGYEVAKGQYLIVEDAELEAIEVESTHVIEID